MILNHRDLNQSQIDAIKDEGNVFLIACPGSGKTRCLTYKIAYELDNLETEKSFIVAITYTNRAADEIHERIESLGIDTMKLWIGTIHSFCLEWVLRPYRLYHEKLRNGFNILNSHDSEEIRSKLCADVDRSIKFRDCDYYYSSAGRELLCSDYRKIEGVTEVLDRYFQILEEAKEIDFEQILLFTYELVKQQPVIAKNLSKLMSFILIDEYQDIKEIQYQIISAILKASNGSTNCFIVGDPNQSIYQTLGGYPISIEGFSKLSGLLFTQRYLENNYRSSRKIISFFRNFRVTASPNMAVGKHRDFPSLISHNTVLHVDDLVDELARLVKLNVEIYGIAQNEICIVAPWWMHLTSLTRKLIGKLPGYRFDGPGMVPFARDRDNYWYKVARIALTVPSPEVYLRRLRWAGELIALLKTSGVNVSEIDSKTLLRKCNSLNIGETEGLKYLRCFFSAFAEDLGFNIEDHLYLSEHLNSFFESSEKRIERIQKDGDIFVDDIDIFRNVFKPKTGIVVSSNHGIKGTEFDTVIAFALLEGMVPHFSDSNGEENARKMIYVIGSRARKNLHLISERGRGSGRWKKSTTAVLASLSFRYDEV